MKLFNSYGDALTLPFLTVILILPHVSSKAGTIIHESATLGPTGQGSGAGLGWDQYIGSRFYVDRAVKVTAIGGHMTEWNSPGNLFGAIVQLTSSTDLPDGSPFYASEVLASTTFDPGFPSSDFRTPLSVTIGPGYYALIFGTDQFGASNGEGAMPMTGQADLPGSSYFIWAYDYYWGWDWYNTTPIQARFVVEGEAGYCSASGGCDEYISGVQVGTINNTGTSCAGYADYTHLSTTMEIGSAYPMTVANGNPYEDGKDLCSIWVDWNQDKDFDDAGETIAVSGSPGLGPYTAVITPPADTLAGDTRMRIRIMYDGSPSSCGTTSYGEVEDYTITIPEQNVLYLKAIEDTYVSSANPDENYSTSNSVYSGYNGSTILRGYLKFDLSSIPPGQVVTAATLRVDNNFISIPAPTLAVYVASDAWDESIVTWNKQPIVNELLPIDQSYVSGDMTTWDVTLDVDTEYANDGFYSVQIKSVDESSATSASFWSTDLGWPDSAPTLEVEYEPIFGGGTGEPNDPYQIWTGGQFNTIGLYPNRWGKHYKLMTDISLADYADGAYNIIGVSADTLHGDGPFSGVFDGRFNSINDFSHYATSSQDADYIGLFGYVHDGTIKDLNVISPQIYSRFYTQTYVGAIAGCADWSDISGCSVIGGSVASNSYVGGLIGALRTSYIANCTSSAAVSGNSKIGGLVGDTVPRGGVSKIMNCSAKGSASGDQYVGGFIGDNTDIVTINCYSTGLVSGDMYTGGFCGRNYENYYANDNIINCFWDVEASQEPNSAGGTGLSTAEMQNENTYINAGWDFVGETANGRSDDWAMPGTGEYPVLWYELPVPPPLPTFAGGSGTIADPYIIQTEEQFNRIGHNPRLMDKHFKLFADLDFKDLKFYMIAEKPYKFSGTFDGAGHTVTNLHINRDLDMSPVGFVANLEGADAAVKNLTLVDPNVVSIRGWGVGSLAGINEFGSITNCYAVNAHVRGLIATGGLVGNNREYGRISGCSATGNIVENDVFEAMYSAIGGLVGENSYCAEIENSYAKCQVSGDDCVGGLVGANLIYGTLENSYSQGNVIGTVDCIGGLVGRNEIETSVNNCYSSTIVNGPNDTDTVGGFVGKARDGSRESYMACFWDNELNTGLPGIGNEPDPNVVGLSTASMQLASTYLSAGWDFAGETPNGTEDIWDICQGTNYPRFVWQIPPADMVCPDGVETTDFAMIAAAWLSKPGDGNWDQTCDISEPKDNVINALDLKALAEGWLEGVE